MSLPRRPWLVVTALALVLGAAATVGAADRTPRIAVLARSDDPVDALAASAIAAQFGGAVYLTAPDTLVAEARDGLVEFAPELVIVAGGPVAISSAVEDEVRAIPLPTRRISGGDRHATARELNRLLTEFDAVFPLASQIDGVVDALTDRVDELAAADRTLAAADAALADVDRTLSETDRRLADQVDALEEVSPVAGPRVRALVVPGDPIVVERGRGVTGVTSPRPGVYCVALAADAGVDPAADVAVVGVEWANSIGDGLAAYWDADDALDLCAGDHYVVQTFAFATDAEPTDVAFTLVVP